LDHVLGHAFISSVREDAGDVDFLQHALESAGVRVWRDTASLWPGDDWREKIRQAINNDTLAFIACFSHNSIARGNSYQNEELTLAIEQLRLRPPGKPWLIPVRFDDCDIPDLGIGGGRALRSIQSADLFGDCRSEGAARVVAAVLRILGQRSADTSGDRANSERQPSGERVHKKSAIYVRLRKKIYTAIGVLAALTGVLTYLSLVPPSGWWHLPWTVDHPQDRVIPHAFKLASPDLDAYCTAIGQGDAQLIPGHMHPWHCIRGPRHVVNLNAACQSTNHNRDAVASIADFYTGAVDCWNATRSFGAPRFDAYCQHDGFHGAVNPNGTVYGWSCAGGGTRLIYVSLVCQWQLGSQNTTAIFSNFYDKDSWRCWG
jgi:hypothetical protein